MRFSVMLAEGYNLIGKSLICLKFYNRQPLQE
jgi:hypothetical protein